MRCHVVTLAAMFALVPVACLAGSVTFATQFPGADGTSRAISFDGDVSGTSVTGQLAADGRKLDVVGEFAKGRVSGEFIVGGQKVGRFSAQVVGQELYGSHDLNGEIGAWTIPLREIPKEARDVLDASSAR